MAKEKGGFGLPCMKNYYVAVQLVPLLYWFNECYRARWKELESSLSKQSPIQAAIAYKGLICHVEKVWNPWLNHTLRVGMKVLNNCETYKTMRLFRWFACDSDFIPNRGDPCFKLWSITGLTTYLSLTQRNSVHCFEFFTGEAWFQTM